jgi:hypothetical protein
MTEDQWQLVPASVLRNGPALIDWCDDRGLRRPSLLEVEEERVRRGLRTGTAYRPPRRVNVVKDAA